MYRPAWFNQTTLRTLVDAYGSPVFVLDPDELRRSYRRFAGSFAAAGLPVAVAYSYKTNYLPAVCRELRDLGAWAAVFSEFEYELARRLGVPPGRVVVGGAAKSRRLCERAAAEHALLDLDTFAELEWAERAARPEAPLAVGLRVTFPLEGRRLESGRGTSRFGFCTTNGDAERAARRIAAHPHLAFAGLHCHFSTTEKRPELFREVARGAARWARELADAGGTDGPRYLNLGGNWPGPDQAENTADAPYREYAEAVADEVRAGLGSTGVIVEPGLAVVGSCLAYVAEVAAVKTVAGERFAVVEGSCMDLGCEPRPAHDALHIPTRTRGRPAGFRVVGRTAAEDDVVFDGVELDDPAAGDFVVARNVGAYSVVCQPQFSFPRAAVVAADGRGGFSLVRRAETADDLLARDVPS